MIGRKRTLNYVIMAAVSVALLVCDNVMGQRGMGDSYGIARAKVKPPVVRLSGKLCEIRNHPCEKTTGWSDMGTHLILENKQGKQLNIHLGPTRSVAMFVELLTINKQLDLLAFRTDKMPEDQYVATTLIVGDRSLVLRDSSLRPYWAGRRGGVSTLAPSQGGRAGRFSFRNGSEYPGLMARGYGRGFRRSSARREFRGQRGPRYRRMREAQVMDARTGEQAPALGLSSGGCPGGRIGRKSLEQFCMDEGIGLPEAIERLGEMGIEAHAGMSMRSIAERLAVHPRQLRTVLKSSN